MSSPSDLPAVRDALTGLQGLAGYTSTNIAVAVPEARSFRGDLVSGNYFDILGVRAAIGRLLDAADEARHVPVAVIAHRVWANDLAADPSVIGRSIRVGDEFVEIVGVAPEYFVGIDFRPARGDRGPDVWLPLWLAERIVPGAPGDQGQRELQLSYVGRLKDEVDVAQVKAQAEVLVGAPALRQNRAARRPLADVARVWRTNPANWSAGVLVIMPVPILVLVIACLNAAILMLARASQRQKEIALRLAVGAGRGRIVRQLLIESALLALLATTIAVPVSWQILRLASTPLLTPIPIDVTVLTFTALTAALTSVAFGLAPALRVSGRSPSLVLGSTIGDADATPGQSRMRRGLLIAQLSLSIGLLATAWQLVATVRSQAVSSGTPPDRLLIAQFDLRAVRRSAFEAELFYAQLLDEASRLSDVEAAGLARPTAVWTFNQQRGGAGTIRVWRPDDSAAEGRVTTGGLAQGDLFAALGLKTVEGRTFTSEEREGRPQVALVTRPFAETMAGSVVGSVIRVAPRDRDFLSSVEVRIVGVIEPPTEPRLEADGSGAANIYLPSPIEAEPALALHLRTRGKAATLAPRVRELVQHVDSRVPILELGSLEDYNERSFAAQLWLARAAALLGVMGLLLASAGLYGASSYLVTMRWREIAIRMAVGASPRLIVAMVVGYSSRIAATGFLVGGSIAIAISRLIQAEYHGIEGIDIVAVGGAAVLFAITMLLASAIPAVRASRVDAAAALKEA